MAMADCSIPSETGAAKASVRSALRCQVQNSRQSSQERTGNCHACGRRERTPLPVLGMRLGAILVGFWFASDGSNIPHARANYLTSSRNNAVKRGARLLLPQCRTPADSCGEPELGAG